MDGLQIKNIIKSLANSQGFYSRLYKEIEENPFILEELEKQNFNDEIDLIIYLEQ